MPATSIRRRRLAVCAIAAGLFAAPALARADDSEFCRGLAIAVAEGAHKFRALRTEQFDNMLESFETNLQLPGLEMCRVDAIVPGYYCMTRKLSQADGDRLAADLQQRVQACYPGVAATQVQDPQSTVPRIVTEWTVGHDRRIRLVRRTYAEHPGSVYLYVR